MAIATSAESFSGGDVLYSMSDGSTILWRNLNGVEANTNIHRVPILGLIRQATIWLLVLVFIIVTMGHLASAQTTTVPFVGCQTSGMISEPPPTGSPVQMNLPTAIASKVAIYAGAYLAVLAPRGWSCSGTGGTTGVILSVYPPDGGPHWQGPLIVEKTWTGDNPQGNSVITSYGGRYFPEIVNHNDIENFINALQLNESQGAFLAKKYDSDTLSYYNDSVLGFVTPPSQNGLGAEVYGSIGIYETFGFLGIANDPSNGQRLSMFGLRLSSDQNSIKSYLLNFARNCFENGINPSCSIDATYQDGDN